VAARGKDAPLFLSQAHKRRKRWGTGRPHDPVPNRSRPGWPGIGLSRARLHI